MDVFGERKRKMMNFEVAILNIIVELVRSIE